VSMLDTGLPSTLSNSLELLLTSHARTKLKQIIFLQR
jgi:hypothetical protein